MTMAEQIIRARKKAGLTQRELAKQLNVTNKAVSRWETGGGMPDIIQLVPLCRVLDLSLQELLDGVEEGLGKQFISSLLIQQTDENKNINTETSNDHVFIRPQIHRQTPTSTYIFGHNLEHTRACIYGGLSAQVLRNRKFAGKPSGSDGCAAEWIPIGAEHTLYVLDSDNGPQTSVAYTHHKEIGKEMMGTGKMNRRNECQALDVQLLKENHICGIRQENLELRACEYKLRIVAKTSELVEIRVALMENGIEDTNGLTYSLTLHPGDWQKENFSMHIPKAGMYSLSITFSKRARVTFGVLSMLPFDHFHGMRHDVIECMKEIGISMLRWPGGNFAGEYRWQDGLLDADERAPLEAYMENETQPYTNGYDYNEVGIDEFIALCREIGAEPFLTINLANASPEENAAWVEYCNGADNTRYGQLRAQRGHKDAYQVRYWSLGNEMGYGHMEGPMTPGQYVMLARRQMRAMLDVSPDLQLFSSGPYPSEEWGTKSAKELAENVKYASLHHYTYVPLDYSSDEAAKNTCQAIMDAPKEAYRLIKEMRTCLGNNIHISFDEWNCWYAWYRPSSAAEGLYAAGMLQLFLNESNAMDMPVCCYFQPISEGAIEIKGNHCRLTATGQVFSMLKAHCGGSLCPSLKNNSVAATIKDNILTISMIHTGQEEPRVFKIQIRGDLLDAKLLSTDSLLPHSRFEEKILSVSETDGIFEVVLPPCSVACVKFRV